MEFRLAMLEELDEIKQMYCDTISHMNQEGIEIWDDIYPITFLEEDILQSALYVLVENGQIVGALALCDEKEENNCIEWETDTAHVKYICRLAVNVKQLRKGIASKLLEGVCQESKKKGVEVLRLLVVDDNKPAFQLYLKNGFVQRPGVNSLVIDEELTLNEYGMEKKIK